MRSGAHMGAVRESHAGADSHPAEAVNKNIFPQVRSSSADLDNSTAMYRMCTKG